jgi:Cys-tRNA(Pro)/Cys-tRNA(Cys) deacylase
MTPAIARLSSAGVDFEVHEFESSQSRGDGAEAARALGVPAERVFKTLVVEIDAEPLELEPSGSDLRSLCHAESASIARAVSST